MCGMHAVNNRASKTFSPHFVGVYTSKLDINNLPRCVHEIGRMEPFRDKSVHRCIQQELSRGWTSYCYDHLSKLQR